MDIQKFKGALTGPYQHRAEIVARALDEPLMKVFVGLSFKSRDSGDKLELTWSLPERVSIRIEKSSGADPQIAVLRPDIRGDSFPDFKHRFRPRSPFDGSYDFAEVIEWAKSAVEYNRQKREECEGLEKAIASELAGLEMPEGATLSRDPKTGLYKLTIPIELCNLKVDALKHAVGVLKSLKQEVGSVQAG